MAGKYQNKPQRSKRWGTVLLIAVLVALLLVVALVAVYISILMDQITYKPNEETLSSSELAEILKPTTEENISSSEVEETLKPNTEETTVDPTEDTAPVVQVPEVTLATDPVVELSNKNVLTILLIGQDRRPGERIARSDTMILCTLNKETGVMTLTSLMRDMYLSIPGLTAPNRINVSFSTGGMTRLKETIRQNFGVVVDGCVEVDFDRFQDLVELMGGVEIALNEAEANYLNRVGASYAFSGQAWNLKAGYNLLTPEQTLAYARVRNVGNADFDRTERQRKVIAAMLGKFKTLSVTQMSDLLMKGAGMVTTDMERSELLGCAFSVLPMLKDLTMNTMRIPSDDGYYNASVDGVGLVLVPDLEKAREQLAQLYR